MRKYNLLTARLARNAQDAHNEQLQNPAQDFRFADDKTHWDGFAYIS